VIDSETRRVFVHFRGWNAKFDRWLPRSLDYIRPLLRRSSRESNRPGREEYVDISQPGLSLATPKGGTKAGVKGAPAVLPQPPALNTTGAAATAGVRTAWTADQDAELAALVGQMGTGKEVWDSIARVFSVPRTAASLRNRWGKCNAGGTEDDGGDDGEPGEMEVEAVLDERSCASGHSSEFRVRWLGFDPSYDTWEPAGNLANAQVRQKPFCLMLVGAQALTLPSVLVMCGYTGED